MKKPVTRWISALMAVVLATSYVGAESLLFTDVEPSEETQTEVQSEQEWEPEEKGLSTKGDLSTEELKTAVLPVWDIPEVVSEADIEANDHVNRLHEQEEDLNTILFQNRDGTKTMYYFSEPVKYEDENGNVKDKKNKLTEQGNNYTNVSNDVNSYFPKKVHKNKGVVLQYNDVCVEIAPLINGSSGASRQTGHNKNADSTEYVEYPNVFGKGISLRYTPTFNGYKEDIIVSQKGEMTSFRFVVRTNGLSLTQSEGYLYLSDPLTGEIKATFAPIYVYDSFEGEITEENPHETYNNSIQVEPVKEDEQYELTILVDEAFLNHPDTVYPVYVDPTLTVKTLEQSAKQILDAPIYDGRPSFAHGGNAYNVIGYVGNWNGAYHGVGRTLVKFPGLMNNTFFQAISSSDIKSANFYMRENSGKSSTKAKIDAYIYDGGNWNETTVKCNTYYWGNYTYYLDTEEFAYVNGGWGNFDITFAVQAWKSGILDWKKGIILKNQNEYITDYYRSFSSTEYGSSLPYVTITLKESFSVKVNNYYDKGFEVRYASKGSSATNLQRINGVANKVFKELFNLTITNNTPILKESTADKCKIKQDGKVIFENLSLKCPEEGPDHDPPCTARKQSFDDFIKNVPCSDNPKYISILWTGNILFNENGKPYNRSFSLKSKNKGISMQKIVTEKDMEKMKDKNVNCYDLMQGTLIHELAHQFGAKDHYHELVNGVCKNRDRCFQCAEPSKKRPEYCVMNISGREKFATIDTKDINEINNIFCEECKKDILTELKKNYKN